MNLPWEKVICWGGDGSDLHSHRHVHRAFADTARKLGLDARAVPDVPESRAALGPGVVCIVANVWDRHIGEAVPGCDYVLHNVDCGHVLRRTVADDRWIALQVWTDDCKAYEGEQWGDVRRWHAPGRTLFGPWGSKLLSEEFLEPVHNPSSTAAYFVGAIWGGDQGNEETIAHVQKALERRRIRFQHLTQVGQEAMIDAARRSRIAPAFAGRWQVEHGYVPCRTLDHPAWGVLAVTNVPRVRALFGDAHVGGESIEELLDAALHLSSRDYVAMVREQQRCVVRHGLTYRDSLDALARAFEEIR